MKTTIDVNRELADKVAAILGTTTLKDTVDAALQDVVRAQLRRRLAQRVLDGTLPVPTPDEYEKMRRPRLPVGALRPRTHTRRPAA